MATMYKQYRIAATCISLVILAALTVYIYYLSYKRYSLFSWHPSFMTLGFVFLMGEAIVILSSYNVFSVLQFSHQQSKQLHWIMHVIAAVSITLGMLSIILHKNIDNHFHFKSWHAVLGLMAVIFCALSCGEGLITMFSLSLRHWIKPSIVKFLHISLGILTFTLGLVAECTGLYTHFFQRVAGTNSQIICFVVLLVACGVVLEGAIKSAYSRFRNLTRNDLDYNIDG